MSEAIDDDEQGRQDVDEEGDEETESVHGSEDMSIIWDEIDNVEDMQDFLETRIRRTVMEWDSYDFGDSPPSSRKIDPIKVNLIGEALKQIPNLKRISIKLSSLNLKTATIAGVALAKSPFLEAVDLTNNDLISCHPEILFCLIRGLSQNGNTRCKALKLKNLYMNHTEAAHVLEPVGRISNLTEIKCKNCSKGIAKSLLDAAARSPTLKIAKFGHKRDRDSEWESYIAFSLKNLIGSSSSLQKLELGPVSSEFIEAVAFSLSINRSLKELVLNGCSTVFGVSSDWEEAGLRIGAIIRTTQSIEKLTLRSFRFGSRAWNDIVQALRKNGSITSLYIDWTSTTNGWPPQSLGAPDFRNLAIGNGTLKELRISGDFLSPERTKDFHWAIGEVGIESLILSNVLVDFACATFAGLTFNTNLRKLDIEVKNIFEPTFHRMREMLQVNRTLKHFVIRCSGTGKHIFNDLSGLFENDSCHLESFGLYGVSTGLSSTMPLQRLLAAVSKAKSFKSLSLDKCTLDVASFRILCTALRTMKHLRHLSFPFPNPRVSRDLDDDLLPELHEELRYTMMKNYSLTSIRVHPFPNSELKKCATACSNRNRLRLFADDKHASTSYIPHLLESLHKNGSDHSSMYLTLKRHLDILPIPGPRKRRRGYSPSC
mmetsp:Transcript_15007/g.28436  ORF Transcript_15007/g.28436 Transcript_15007/m.28436 type:complete len:656 (-) Transcript_15007:13-1980(-)